MTNYREILRLHSLGLNKTEIAASLHCARNTVAATLQRADNCGLQWPLPDEMSDRQLAERLFPSAPGKPAYKMPDYAYVYREMQNRGVTLNLLWLEYCDQCKASGKIPYQSTQFNKYYSDYLNKTNATMHLNHKPGEVMQVDWAGDTASVIDTDAGEVIPAFVFVATLPYSGYSYVEAFFSMNQECWTAAHVNAYRYFGGVTRMIQCDNLKTGVEKHGKDEVVLNKSYQELAEHYATAIVPARVRAPKDYATIEEIYDKVYEAGFRDFQKRQRPCRRYNGTYLEQIREKQNKADKKNRANSKEKNRTMSEAIEIVFCIGDMDNTGYRAAPEDAAKSEALLHDFCDHLMMDSHLCAVTSRELEDPNWKPPFKYGLLVLNLSLHADEATPGVHLTCIPYASGFRRGPEVQPAMGKAFAGMGYPSTWQNVLDDQGQPIPKRDKEGNRILNQDGSIRYKQEPAGQGVIDWIEDQKRWLQKEMERRYQWGREYKGSHPRGNLTIPDYKAARAAERLNELELRMQIALQEYAQQIDELTENLTTQIDESFPNITEWEIICRYLNICPEEEYQEILKRADEYILSLPQEESRKAKLSLSKMIQMAQSQSSPKEKERQAKSKTPVAERENENR